MKTFNLLYSNIFKYSLSIAEFFGTCALYPEQQKYLLIYVIKVNFKKRFCCHTNGLFFISMVSDAYTKPGIRLDFKISFLFFNL